MSPRPSFFGRALLALLLMIGFYLLAAGIAATLLWLPYAEWRYAGRVHAKVALFCGIGAVLILWSVIPRPDRFTPPGPRLQPKDHPRLFRTLAAVAEQVGQRMPAEVYLVGDVNAWVAQRGGVMGLGGRRVMGLGLPLLRVLSVAEMKAVIAHEFGHFHGGDTRLGPWIYQTRAAIGRTLDSLAKANSYLVFVFQAYGKLFLRLTHAVSRAQEFAADRLAATVVGPRAVAESLRRVEGAAPAFQAYVHGELLPVLNAQRRPPVAEGFADFLGSKEVALATRDVVQRELTEGTVDPYDTHPPLRERLGAIADLPAEPLPAGDPPALSLLENLAALEAEVLVHMTGEHKIAGFKTVGWDAVGRDVLVPQWEQHLKTHGRHLPEVRLGALPTLKDRVVDFGRKMGSGLDRAVAVQQGTVLVGVALTITLLRNGFDVSAPPGPPVTCTRDGQGCEPFVLVTRLCDGRLDAAGWDAACARLGIGELLLARE